MGTDLKEIREQVLDSAPAAAAPGGVAERLALEGIRRLRARARRRDLVGDVLHRGLRLVHGGLSGVVEELRKYQEATAPVPRSAARRSSRSRPAA